MVMPFLKLETRAFCRATMATALQGLSISRHAMDPIQALNQTITTARNSSSQDFLGHVGRGGNQNLGTGSAEPLQSSKPTSFHYKNSGVQRGLYKACTSTHSDGQSFSSVLNTKSGSFFSAQPAPFSQVSFSDAPSRHQTSRALAIVALGSHSPKAQESEELSAGLFLTSSGLGGSSSGPGKGQARRLHASQEPAAESAPAGVAASDFQAGAPSHAGPSEEGVPGQGFSELQLQGVMNAAEVEEAAEQGGVHEPPETDNGPAAAEDREPAGTGLPSERKRRPAALGRRAVASMSDLLTVPGIGLRTQAKLNAKGIMQLEGLKQLYLEQFMAKGHPERMVEYLRSDVGVRKHHAVTIAAFVQSTVEMELQAERREQETPSTSRQKRLTFCVEGNISVGKTTFLQRIARETVELRDLVEVVPEPIGKWQDIGGEGYNILDAFYGNPERYAYTFQNYVFMTRLMQERESARGQRPLRIMERSVFSDRMVFVRAVHEAKWMDNMELSIYESWFDPMVSSLPGLVPDGFIYLRAQPDTCHQRLQRRARGEEAAVSLDYLTGLHEKHEQWLIPAQRAKGSSGLLGVGEWVENAGVAKPPGIEVFTLRGDHMPSYIQEIPALVLDCDPNIDFNRDVNAQAEYARQVRDFFQYVTDMKAAQEAEGGPFGSIIRPASPSLLLPGASIALQKQLEAAQQLHFS